MVFITLKKIIKINGGNFSHMYQKRKNNIDY